MFSVLEYSIVHRRWKRASLSLTFGKVTGEKSLLNRFRIQLPEYILDFGYIILGDVRNHIIKITNTSHFPVSFHAEKRVLHDTGNQTEDTLPHCTLSFLTKPSVPSFWSSVSASSGISQKNYWAINQFFTCPSCPRGALSKAAPVCCSSFPLRIWFVLVQASVLS